MNHSLSSLLTSRRGAWAVLAIALVLMVALFGLLRGADAPARSTHAPVDSESARVSALLEQFPDQMNIVNLEAGGKKQSALFREGAEEQQLTW